MTQTLWTKQHYELLANFEKEFKGHRLDKEPKDLWPNGIIFQDGQVNNLFLAYRSGHALGKAEARMEAA